MMITLSIIIGLLVVSIGLNIFLALSGYAAYKKIFEYEREHGVRI